MGTIAASKVVTRMEATLLDVAVCGYHRLQALAVHNRWSLLIVLAPPDPLALESA